LPVNCIFICESTPA